MSIVSILARLSAVRHADLRLLDGIDTSQHDDGNHAWLGFDEIDLAACDYPLAFLKDAQTGQFRLIALFGFQAGQNYFVAERQWYATFVPRSILLRPLVLSGAPLHLCVNEGSEFVSTHSGKRLFDDDGLETQFLANIRTGIETLVQGFDSAQTFAQVCSGLGLIQKLTLTLTNGQGGSNVIEGLYHISQTALLELADEDIVSLARQGYLGAASVMAASLGQLNRLQQLSNAANKDQITHIKIEIERSPY